MKKVIDLRSDTVTLPTDEMKEAILEAPLGDDVLEEDPTVNKLEELAADIMGKEAALLVPSGTFGNQLALFTHCNRGDEVILSENSHIVQHEVGAASIIAGVQLRTISSQKSYIIWDEIKSRIREFEDIHFPETKLIELENALSNGDVMPLEDMEIIYENAKKNNINIHLDGARIFNAAIYLNVDVKEITQYTDSVMFCLSKGLAAPVGSILAGTSDFIKKARKKRKVMGGGMRQAGIIAAPGIIALTKMVDRLKEDHENAKRLAAIFAKFEDIFEVDIDRVKINMLFIKIKNSNYPETEKKFINILLKYNILTYPPEGGFIRFVTHKDVTAEDIGYIEKIFPQIINEL